HRFARTRVEILLQIVTSCERKQHAHNGTKNTKIHKEQQEKGGRIPALLPNTIFSLCPFESFVPLCGPPNVTSRKGPRRSIPCRCARRPFCRRTPGAPRSP